MSTCVVCAVHQPAENSDECTARCKHTPAKVGLVCAQCAADGLRTHGRVQASRRNGGRRTGGSTVKAEIGAAWEAAPDGYELVIDWASGREQ